MARTRSRSGGRGALRTVVLGLAVLAAAASTAAVVVAEDPQVLRLAIVGALWAFVLAAFAAPRRTGPGADEPGTEVELRRTYEIELEREVAARREYELQLEVYLRRELERGLAEELAALREDVSRMRGEMIDRLDGELRMERIETTRLIGGSLRALQDEARRLGIGLPIPRELSAVIEEPAVAPPFPPPPAAERASGRQPAPGWPGADPGGPEQGGQRYAEPGPGGQQAAYQPVGVDPAGGLPPPAYESPAPRWPLGDEPAPRWTSAGEDPPAGRWDSPAASHGSAGAGYSPYPSYAEPGPLPGPAGPPPAASPAGQPVGQSAGQPGGQPAGQSVGPPPPPGQGPRRRRARADGEGNEVMS